MEELPKCEICGRPAIVYITDMSDGAARELIFCTEHAPAEFGDIMPKTPDDEVTMLRSKLALLNQSVTDPILNAKIRADMEQVIDDIEAGRKRLNDLL